MLPVQLSTSCWKPPGWDHPTTCLGSVSQQHKALLVTFRAFGRPMSLCCLHHCMPYCIWFITISLDHIHIIWLESTKLKSFLQKSKTYASELSCCFDWSDVLSTIWASQQFRVRKENPYKIVVNSLLQLVSYSICSVSEHYKSCVSVIFGGMCSFNT